MMTEYDTNQTQFAEDQPLFQDVMVPEVHKQAPEEEVQKQISDQKKIILVVSIFVVFLLLLLLVLFMPKKVVEVAEVGPSPSPSPVVSVDNPLRERVSNLRTELDAADPKNQLLVFPPVDMDVHLDRVSNR